jgi:hypothetical protein
VKAHLDALRLSLDPDLVVETRVVSIELDEAGAKTPLKPRRIGGEPRLGQLSHPEEELAGAHVFTSSVTPSYPGPPDMPCFMTVGASSPRQMAGAEARLTTDSQADRRMEMRRRPFIRYPSVVSC